MFEWPWVKHEPWVWMIEFRVLSDHECVWHHHGLEMPLTINDMSMNNEIGPS